MVDYKVTELAETIDFGNLPYWDVVIIGAGPGGLAASLTTAHRGLTTLVVEAKDKAGGQPQFLYADKNIVDVPGFPDGIRGDELSNRVYRQAVNALVQFRFQEELVTVEETGQVEKEDRLKRVVTTRDEYLCRKVILACGLLHYPRRLAVLDALESKKVFYKIPKIGDYEGHGVAIVGGGFTGLWSAIALTDTDPGLRVAVLEQETVSYGASGRNGGFCEASLTHGLANGIKHFPGLRAEAGALLARDRKVAGIGIDTASVDYGPSAKFETHHATMLENVYHIENAAHLTGLPPKGFTVVVAPVNLAGGSGGPTRIFALLETR